MGLTLTTDISMPDSTIIGLKNSAIDNFEALMQAATGDASAYRVAIDKIEQISLDSTAALPNGTTPVPDAQFSPSEKAKMIAELAAAIVPQITNQAMQLGVTMAKEDRDATYGYPAIVADVTAKIAQANKTDADTLVVGEQEDKIKHENLTMQAAMKRDFGVTNSWSTGIPTDLTLGADGTKYWTQVATGAQGYYTYGKSYRENGSGTVVATTPMAPVYSLFTNASATEASSLAAGLTANQTRVQWRTYEGFDDNMAQHAVNASANMVATMFTTDSSATETLNAIGTWENGMTKLGVTVV